MKKKIVKKFQVYFLFFHTFRGNFRLRGRVVANETSKIVIYAKFWVYFMLRFHVPICSCTTLKNVRIYLENQVTRVQTLLIFIASPYLRTFFWAFSDSQRSGLSEIYPKNWWFWHCRNTKNVHFWTKKNHCATFWNSQCTLCLIVIHHFHEKIFKNFS